MQQAIERNRARQAALKEAYRRYLDAITEGAPPYDSGGLFVVATYYEFVNSAELLKRDPTV